jgi:FkbM family methyltransferase
MKAIVLKTIRIINSFLKPVGAKLVSSGADSFDMYSAIKRINDHGIKINNVIDIGASNGIWSRNAFKFFPKASFVAIEPLKEREKALQNLKQTCQNFDYELCVAGEKNGGYTTLNIADDLDGSTVNGSGGEARKVPVKTIDAIVSERNLPGPFLLKFDTHGYEVPILKGAMDTLKKTTIIIIEVYNFPITANSLRFHQMCAHMVELGFRCYDIAGLMLREHDKSFWQMDLLFCRDDSKIFKYSHYK